MVLNVTEMITLSAGSMLFAFDGAVLYVRILTPGGMHDSKSWEHTKEYWKLRQRRLRAEARAAINVG